MTEGKKGTHDRRGKKNEDHVALEKEDIRRGGRKKPNMWEKRIRSNCRKKAFYGREVHQGGGNGGLDNKSKTTNSAGEGNALTQRRRRRLGRRKQNLRQKKETAVRGRKSGATTKI